MIHPTNCFFGGVLLGGREICVTCHTWICVTATLGQIQQRKTSRTWEEFNSQHVPSQLIHMLGQFPPKHPPNLRLEYWHFGRIPGFQNAPLLGGASGVNTLQPCRSEHPHHAPLPKTRKNQSKAIFLPWGGIFQGFLYITQTNCLEDHPS